MVLPDFSFEKKLWKQGFNIIAGVDEVGRGSFAGPVVAGCVVFKKTNLRRVTRERVSDVGWRAAGSPKAGVPLWVDLGLMRDRTPPVVINDSKKLSPKQREIADKWIRKNAHAWGIGSASVAEINRFGIKKASEMAFRRAIVNCKLKIDYLLIDAFYIPYIKGLRRKNQKPIIKGDTKSRSIAAASIIAKVYRDKLMVKLGKNRKYKRYGWDQNKGYGTLVHQNAIKKYGITRLHRKKFVETWEKNHK